MKQTPQLLCKDLHINSNFAPFYSMKALSEISEKWWDYPEYWVTAANCAFHKHIAFQKTHSHNSSRLESDENIFMG